MQQSGYTPLAGKVALVTGASQGIGAGIAESMADAGASVVLAFVGDHTNANNLATKIEGKGGRALTVEANIAVVADVERLFVEAIAAFGKIDILVNNAGVFEFGPIEQMTDEQIHKMLSVNLWGVIIMCREAVKHIGSGGSIINIGSMASEIYSPNSVVYAATKAGVTGVTGVLAVELGPRGIRVNQINPGSTDTEGARAVGAMSDEMRAFYISKTPLGRLGYPPDIAAIAVFLASEAASWLTGETLAASGGMR